MGIFRQRLLYVTWPFSIFLDSQGGSYGRVWHHMKFISFYVIFSKEIAEYFRIMHFQWKNLHTLLKFSTWAPRSPLWSVLLTTNPLLVRCTSVLHENKWWNLLRLNMVVLSDHLLRRDRHDIKWVQTSCQLADTPTKKRSNFRALTGGYNQLTCLSVKVINM